MTEGQARTRLGVLLLAEPPAAFAQALPALAMRLGARMRVALFDVTPRHAESPYLALVASTLAGEPRLVVLPAWEDEERAWPLDDKRGPEVVHQVLSGACPPSTQCDLVDLSTGTTRGFVVLRLAATASGMTAVALALQQALGDLFFLTLTDLPGPRGALPVMRLYGTPHSDADPWILAFPSYRADRVHRSERLTDADLLPLMELLATAPATETPMRAFRR